MGICKLKKKEVDKMLVKACFKNKDFNYFRDVETNDKRVYGDIFECNDELAKARIEKGLVKKASQKEEKEYLKQQEELKKQAPIDDASANDNGDVKTGNDDDKPNESFTEGDLSKNDDEFKQISVSSEQEEQQMIDDINNNCNEEIE